VRGEEQIGLLRLGQLLESAGGPAATERRPLMHGELVAGEMVGREGRHLFELLPPRCHGLAGAGVDEVDGDRVDTGVTRPYHRSAGLRRGVATTEKPQRLVVERLDPQTQHADTQGDPGFQSLRRDVFRIRLQVDAHVRVDGESRPHRGEDLGDLVRRMERRRTATEVDRVDRTAPS